jgi:hypothetical protein
LGIEEKQRKSKREKKRKKKKGTWLSGDYGHLQRPNRPPLTARSQVENFPSYWNFIPLPSPAPACHVVADYDCASRGPSTA